MEYIIGGLILLVVLYVAGYLTKKKLYKEVDRLESWKIDILNRPVLDEMSRVKQLNMTGETEELFENWRNSWDDIVTSQLPKVEDFLFDSEEYIDRYRFGKAKQVLQSIINQLEETEEKITNLLEEINELVGSEEKNRIEIEGLKENYRNRRKVLLAHRHNFGVAEAILEQHLDEVVSLFNSFEERTENGDYLQAREIVLSIQQLLQLVGEKMDAIPNLLVEYQSSMPSQIAELRDGYREMLAQGYPLDHLNLEEEIDKLMIELENFSQYLAQTDLAKLNEGLESIRAQLDDLYDMLEKEVEAKQYVLEHESLTKSLLFSTKEENHVLSFELQQVLKNYELSPSELEEPLQFERELAKLIKRFELIEHRILSDKIALTVLQEELSNVKGELESIKEGQMNFSKKLHTLRKDEMAARETVSTLNKKISEALRLVNKSNIPGLPENYRYLLEDASESIKNVKLKLEDSPLNIPAVQKHLELAVLSVEKLHSETTDLLDTVLLSEKVIQYGNRYRSKYPAVRKALSEAEMAFRKYEYHAALELAATSIEDVEPGALKRIESIIQETVEV